MVIESSHLVQTNNSALVACGNKTKGSSNRYKGTSSRDQEIG